MTADLDKWLMANTAAAEAMVRLREVADQPYPEGSRVIVDLADLRAVLAALTPTDWQAFARAWLDREPLE